MDATGREREVQLQSALEAIFDALSLPVPEVPEELEGLELRLDYMPVSYTHLDVYKRQPSRWIPTHPMG